MATTDKTLDAVIRFVRSDAAAAKDITRELGNSGLRVELDPIHDLGQREPSTLRSSARVDLIVVGDRGLQEWLEAESTLVAGPATVESGVLIAPGVGDVAARRLRTGSRAWDMRAAWDSGVAWRKLADDVIDIGMASEAEVEAQGSLSSSNLRSANLDSYNHIAEQFAEQWFDHPPDAELEFFLRNLAPRSIVLDAGCGPAHHARRISMAGHRVIAIDLSESMLEQARKRVTGIRLMKMDLEYLTFSASSFDGVWCAAAILHVPRECVGSVMRGFRRVLRPSGLLALNFQVGRPSELVERGRDRRFFEYYPDAGELASLLHATGFSVEAALHGRTRRNTHGLDIELSWSTLYARRTVDAARPVSRPYETHYPQA